MVEMVIDTKTLPESLTQLIHTEKVKVSESDGGMSVDGFIANKQIEKELER